MGISDELCDNGRFDEDLAVVGDGRDEAALLSSRLEALFRGIGQGDVPG